MLPALDLGFVSGLIVAASVLLFRLLSAPALLGLANAGFTRSLLAALVGMLPAFHLSLVAGLIVSPFCLIVCHSNFSMCCDAVGSSCIFTPLLRSRPLETEILLGRDRVVRELELAAGVVFALEVVRMGTLAAIRTIQPWLALGVVASTAATDAAYVLFTAAVTARRRVQAANWSSAWYLLSAFAVISYTRNWAYVCFAAAGSWLGAYASVSLLRRPRAA